MYSTDIQRFTVSNEIPSRYVTRVSVELFWYPSVDIYGYHSLHRCFNRLAPPNRRPILIAGCRQ